MSTSTLLIVTARLRGLARADGDRRPALSATFFGWAWVARRVGVAGIFTPFRWASTGSRPSRALPAARSLCPLADVGARLSLARARVLIFTCLFVLLGPILPPYSAVAQQPRTPPQQAGEANELLNTMSTLRVEGEPPVRIGGKPAPGPCVIVDIAGDRAGHLDCATDRLQEAARTAQARSNAGIDADVAAAGSPDVRVGVAHQAATRLRMGDGFGRSVHSERPNRPMPMPRGGQP